jgi:hypothetical protein
MMGDSYHRAALQIIAGSFGWVIDGETSLRLLDSRSTGDRVPQ